MAFPKTTRTRTRRSQVSRVEPDEVFAHQGYANVLKMTEMLNEMFTVVPKMFVGGCSAGGAGAIVNYYFPFYRTTNSSHCVTISGLEEFSLGEGPFVPCTPADFDADACEAAVNPPEM